MLLNNVSRMLAKSAICLISSVLCTACLPSPTPNTDAARGANPSDNVPLTPAPQPAAMQGMLEVHNQVRASVGVPPLQWSGRMSAYAQAWAEQLARTNNCKMQHRSHADAAELPVGENLYWASAVMWSDGHNEVQAVTPAAVAQAWADERADYQYASDTCTSGKQCGHYTQMVWRDSTEVGCGMTICPNKEQLWVCNYNPRGNWVGEKPY